VLALGISVAGETGEVAARLASGIARHLKRGTVGQADTTDIEQPDQAFLHNTHECNESAKSPVVLGLIGHMREPAGKHLGDQPEELPVGAYAHGRLADGQSDQFRITDPGWPPIGERDLVVIGEQVCCNNEGFQI
jgi:hypothetical protein